MSLLSGNGGDSIDQIVAAGGNMLDWPTINSLLGEYRGLTEGEARSLISARSSTPVMMAPPAAMSAMAPPALMMPPTANASLGGALTGALTGFVGGGGPVGGIIGGILGGIKKGGGGGGGGVLPGVIGGILPGLPGFPGLGGGRDGEKPTTATWGGECPPGRVLRRKPFARDVCVKKPRMNPFNPRALARADRRVTSFARRSKAILQDLGYKVSPRKKSVTPKKRRR